MSEYAYMPFSDYEDACDAIRAKTGESGLIKSGDMANAIAAIPSGGGDFPWDWLEVATGSFTIVSSVSTDLTILHGLGVIPFMVIVMPKENFSVDQNRNLGGLGFRVTHATNQAYLGVRFYTNSTYPRFTHNPSTEPNDSPSTTYVTNFTDESFHYIASAAFPPVVGEYAWVAFAFKE